MTGDCHAGIRGSRELQCSRPPDLLEVRDSCATVSTHRSSRSLARSSPQWSRYRPSLDILFSPYRRSAKPRDWLREVRPGCQADYLARGLAEQLGNLGEPDEIGERAAGHYGYNIVIRAKCPGAAGTARGVATGGWS